MNNRGTTSVPLDIVAVLVVATNASSDIIINVGPSDSIQAAMDATVDGDEIIIATGTYFEAINFLGKAITVRSTDPTDPVVVASTIINGTGNFHVVQCVSGEGPDTVVRGCTITGVGPPRSAFSSLEWRSQHANPNVSLSVGDPSVSCYRWLRHVKLRLGRR